MQPPLARALVAELIGTFALVFAGAGAVMVDAKTHALGQVGVAFTFGLVIMVMIYAVGHVSGAHFNPAVTFAFSLSRHFPWRRAVVYWVAQVTGAVLARVKPPLMSRRTAEESRPRNGPATGCRLVCGAGGRTAR